MKRMIPLTMIGLVLWHSRPLYAANMINYGLIQESSYFILSLGCLAIAGFIYKMLKGGSLGTPWLFFIVGFSLAGIYTAVQILDTLKVVVYQYDYRLAMLVMQTGSMLFLLIGLILYKKGLE